MGRKRVNLYIPATEDKAPRNPVSGHFGSAPSFAIVDPDARVSAPSPTETPTIAMARVTLWRVSPAKA